MIEFNDEDLLMLSGIQHFAFCSRQWALIHIEQQWSENMKTVEGKHMHERVDDFSTATQNEKSVTLRSIALVSKELGLYGQSDAIELLKADTSENSIQIENFAGYWYPFPIEYKRGNPKPDERDEVQLCAQAMCLEEMFHISIVKGWLYYGETRHRHEVEFTPYLRLMVVRYADQMHKLYKDENTPLPVHKAHCKACSLYDLCLPKTFSKREKVNKYLVQLFENPND